MTAPRDLDILMTGLLDNAISIWQRDKMVATCSWALGAKASAFAQPFDHEGWTISLETRAGLHALVAACVDAQVIGRIDETWTKMMSPDETPLVHGELQDMADTDPDVKTALCVQAYDLLSGRSYLHMAHLDLFEDGSDHWVRTYADEPEGRIVGGSELTARAIPILTQDVDLTPDVVEQFLNALHWTMVVAELSS